MNIVFYVLFVVLNFFSLFRWSKHNGEKTLIAFAVSLASLLLSAFVCSLSIQVFNLQFPPAFSAVFFSGYVSAVVIAAIGMVNQIFFKIVDSVIHFHITKNSTNIHRNPIKFLISNQSQIKKTVTIVWFIGSLIMLSGVWFGK